MAIVRVLRVAAIDRLRVASSHGALSLSPGVRVTGSVAGDSGTGVLAKSGDDGCGDGVLQEDDRRLPNEKRTASLLQHYRQHPSSRRVHAVQFSDSTITGSRSSDWN